MQIVAIFMQMSVIWITMQQQNVYNYSKCKMLFKVHDVGFLDWEFKFHQKMCTAFYYLPKEFAELIVNFFNNV